MNRNDRGKVFHVAGPATEKAQLLSLVLVRTVIAGLVLKDRSWLLLESAVTN